MPSAFFSIKGKDNCLDATYRYLPPEDIPQGIQGRKALVENGDSCLIPDSSPAGCLRLYGQSQLSLSLDDGQQSPYLKGTATRVSTGEYKEYLLSLLP